MHKLMTNKNTNISILIGTLGKGGAEKQSLLLANALKDSYKVTLLIQNSEKSDKEYMNFLLNEEINHICLNGGFFSRLRQLLKHLRISDTKILFSYLTLDNLLASMCKLFNRRLIVVGGVRNCFLPRVKYLLTKILHKYLMDYLIFNNHSGREAFVKDGFAPDKCISIPNCIDHIEPPFQRPDKQEINILTVGRFVEQKDFFTAINSFNTLQQSEHNGKKYKLTIIGYGKLEQSIRMYIDQNKIRNIEIIVRPNNLPEYYRSSDIFLSASKFEGFSNTIMEALNYSLPVVATNVGDNSFLVHDGKNGFLVPRSDSNRMAERIKILAVNPDLRNSMAAYGYTLLHKNYSIGSFIKNYCEFIEEILVDMQAPIPDEKK